MTTLFYPSQLPQTAYGASTRWYPTPEQLAILRTLYRKGIRTLSASQIRVIASYLSFFGRIEPKNVFYWFQNRKARDRKKLRQFLSLQRRMSSSDVAAVHGTTSMPQPPQQSVVEYLHPFQTHLFGAYHNAHQFLQHQGHTFSLSPGGTTLDETTQEENLSYEPDAISNTEVEKQPTINGSGEHDWIKIINLGAKARRPVHTLELFPTKNNIGALRM